MICRLRANIPQTAPHRLVFCRRIITIQSTRLRWTFPRMETPGHPLFITQPATRILGGRLQFPKLAGYGPLFRVQKDASEAPPPLHQHPTPDHPVSRSPSLLLCREGIPRPVISLSVQPAGSPGSNFK